jgi:hypothetical protein
MTVAGQPHEIALRSYFVDSLATREICQSISCDEQGREIGVQPISRSIEGTKEIRTGKGKVKKIN